MMEILLLLAVFAAAATNNGTVGVRSAAATNNGTVGVRGAVVTKNGTVGFRSAADTKNGTVVGVRSRLLPTARKVDPGFDSLISRRNLGSIELVITKAQKYEFDKIFDDDGTGSYQDGALWKPKNGNYWFGAVASSEYNAVCRFGTGSKRKRTSDCYKGLYATEYTNDMLSEPARWEKIWDDEDSGACKDRSLWKAIPQDGYVCLGHVGIGRGGCWPASGVHFSNSKQLRICDYPNYRCVKKEYVQEISNSKFKRVWRDKGSGAKEDASLWAYISPMGYSFGFANNRWGRPAGPFYDFKPSVFGH